MAEIENILVIICVVIKLEVSAKIAITDPFRERVKEPRFVFIETEILSIIFT